MTRNILDAALHAVVGERKRVVRPEQIRTASANLKEAAYTAVAYTGKNYFPFRQRAIVPAIAEEGVLSARHFATEISDRKGAWQQAQFWRDIKGLLRNAVDVAAPPFINAFSSIGTPETSPEGTAAYEAAHHTPGAAVANRAYLMEVMARIQGSYAYELGRNPGPF